MTSIPQSATVTDEAVQVALDEYYPAFIPSENAHDDMRRALTAALPHLALSPSEPVPGEPDFSKSIAEVIKEESLGGAACGWKSCTGCLETNDGYHCGEYPYSEVFKTHAGSGCSECGGIGVVWEYYSKSDLDEMLRDPLPAVPVDQSRVAQLEAALTSILFEDSDNSEQQRMIDRVKARAVLEQSEPVPMAQDVINLVIAGRELVYSGAVCTGNQEGEALDKALEAFASRAPWENEPDEPAAPTSKGGE